MMLQAIAMGVTEFLPNITVSEWNANLKKEILSWFSTTLKVITSQAWCVTHVYNSGPWAAETGRLP